VRSQPGWSRGATRPAKKRHSSSSRRQNTVRRGEIRLPPAIKKTNRTAGAGRPELL
jgi:hypothetical protein